ncbi:hypothetical protein [Mucilaginibacter sp. 10I4]|uniref:hypothetical protein n=1 Tax=Mucilaginibacter sp. 10I4 TaxID=3048580 RepID=UPI002B224CF9|nr:hypothetical protein [Mucilaginibacter sp. 10I4]MEB0262876.1 hypothetical protein [Mucilaginibacter sp. 10I4]
MNTELQKHVPEESAFSMQSFEHAQRVAKMLSSSDLIPAAYRNNIQNTMIALEMANRIGASPLMVMQNLNIIQGKPSWGSSFIIAVINNCGKFTALRFIKSGAGETLSCYATAQDKVTGEKLEGPEISMAMAHAEGWVSKSGSKWKTMPELMIRYRSAAFFGRLYAPELLMGMHSVEEVLDIKPTKTELPSIEITDKLSTLKAYASGQITVEEKDEWLLSFES